MTDQPTTQELRELAAEVNRKQNAILAERKHLGLKPGEPLLGLHLDEGPWHGSQDVEGAEEALPSDPELADPRSKDSVCALAPSTTESGWYATPAYWGTFFKHRMKDWRIAACGERHYEWWPVERFADPAVFAECPECAKVDEP